MKRLMALITGLAFILMIVSVSCTKETTLYDKDTDMSGLKEEITLKDGGRFEKVVTKRLIKPDDCRFVVSGTIEYRLDGAVVAIVDYGDGTCDNVATKTMRGTTTRFLLEPEGSGEKYRKIIREPLVSLEGCDYIVSGIVDFYQDGGWVAAIDFGDGTCDNLAIKYWDGGRKEIRLDKD